MQRTVYSTKFTYAHTVINEDNTLTTELESITIHETDEKKALKKAFKEIGNFAPLKTEKVSALYVLDDEIFFKYATIKTDATEKEKTENTEK